MQTAWLQWEKRDRKIGRVYLVLALDNLLHRKKSSIATNLSTSMLIDDVARKYAVNVIRSKIGEANVVEEMKNILFIWRRG
jgi:phosphomannomutase